MNAKTIEQLKEEARIAAEAVAQAEQAAREAQREKERAEREAALREEARKRIAANLAALAPVQAALIAAGDNNVVSADMTDHGTLRVIGPQGKYGPSIINISREAETRSVSSWRRASTGRYVLLLSGCGERDVRYPPRKTGGYNTDKIAAEVASRFEGAAAAHEREQSAATQKERAEALAADVKKRQRSRMQVVGYRGHYAQTGSRRHEYYETIASKGKVFCEIGTLELTPEQALALDEALVPFIPLIRILKEA